MSDYGMIVTTNQGKNMVTESIRTHSAIIFTKISLGDGLLNGETIETMTALKHRLMDGNVPKINHLGNGEIEAVSTVSNSELTAGFFARELGLFAKLGEEGEEQLFAYTNAGSNASYIPPNTSVDEKMLGIQLGVGDAIVQVNYQSHLYITYEQLEDGIAHHNNDEHAHDNRFNKYLPTAGGTVTGNVKFNNASVGFNNGNNTYDAKIIIASNGNFDIGVTEDSANKNATTQLLLHSQNKPKWYNSSGVNKELATTEDITNAITAVDNDVASVKAPTLQLVKTLLSSLNIKNATDVVKALESEKATGLGIRYDFSNPNAWYICLGKLFGNLIIQGGRKLNMNVYDNLNYQQPFPISFSKNCLGVLVTLEGRGPVSGASVAYTNNRKITEFTIVTDASNAEAKSDLFYIALGI